VPGLPEASERLSHGHPAFFVGKKNVAHFVTGYSDDGRPRLWCPAPDGAQELLIEAAPDTYFRPPYVGHRGWLGVRLDTGIDDNELAGVLEDAFLTTAPKKLIAAYAG
jgi:hypothetical protein